jgi:hypothetical protein
VIVNRGAKAYWEYGGKAYQSRSNSVVNRPMYFLPMILCSAAH